jgi:predicted ATP-dependent Lon-type protease
MELLSRYIHNSIRDVHDLHKHVNRVMREIFPEFLNEKMDYKLAYRFADRAKQVLDEQLQDCLPPLRFFDVTCRIIGNEMDVKWSIVDHEGKEIDPLNIWR